MKIILLLLLTVFSTNSLHAAKFEVNEGKPDPRRTSVPRPSMQQPSQYLLTFYGDQLPSEEEVGALGKQFNFTLINTIVGYVFLVKGLSKDLQRLIQSDDRWTYEQNGVMYAIPTSTEISIRPRATTEEQNINPENLVCEELFL